MKEKNVFEKLSDTFCELTTAIRRAIAKGKSERRVAWLISMGVPYSRIGVFAGVKEDIDEYSLPL